MVSSDENLALIDEKLETVKRKACMFGKNEIVNLIVELMNSLDM